MHMVFDRLRKLGEKAYLISPDYKSEIKRTLEENGYTIIEKCNNVYSSCECTVYRNNRKGAILGKFVVVGPHNTLSSSPTNYSGAQKSLIDLCESEDCYQRGSDWMRTFRRIKRDFPSTANENMALFLKEIAK